MGSYLAPTQCSDAYTAAATVGPNFACDHANVTVGANEDDTSACLFQVGIGHPGDWEWTLEREFTALPETFTVKGIIAIRFRNRLPGVVATVACNLLGPEDPDFGAAAPL